MNFIRAFCIALAWLPVAALAHQYQLKSLSIDHPFTRATPRGAKSGGAFFVVQNASPTPDKLIGAASPAAGTAPRPSASAAAELLVTVGSAALACWGGYMMLTALEKAHRGNRAGKPS